MHAPCGVIHTIGTIFTGSVALDIHHLLHDLLHELIHVLFHEKDGWLSNTVGERAAPPVFAATRHERAAEAPGAEAPGAPSVRHLQHISSYTSSSSSSSNSSAASVGSRSPAGERHGHQWSTDLSDPPLNFWMRRTDHLLQHSRDKGPHLRHGGAEDLHHGHEVHDRGATHPGGKHFLIVAKSAVHRGSVRTVSLPGPLRRSSAHVAAMSGAVAVNMCQVTWE